MLLVLNTLNRSIMNFSWKRPPSLKAFVTPRSSSRVSPIRSEARLWNSSVV